MFDQNLAPRAALSGTETDAPWLSVRDLTVRFVTRDSDVSVINGVSFDLRRGSSLCLLGESGSGKSVTIRTLMKLLPPSAKIGGHIEAGGEEILKLSSKRLRAIRGRKIAMVFQEPMTALDPVFTIGAQIAEMVVAHKGCSMQAGRARALELLQLVQVPNAAQRLNAYPHELSGGLRQRAMIALALSCDPELLLADEPTTALDATVQIQVLLLMRQLQVEMGMTSIFVTHDLGVACEVADQIAVMYAGRIVERATSADLMARPSHPYTRGLLHSTVHGDMRGQVLDAIPGAPPNLANLPQGCAFAPRCAEARAICRQAAPEAALFGNQRLTRCHIEANRAAWEASAP